MRTMKGEGKVRTNTTKTIIATMLHALNPSGNVEMIAEGPTGVERRISLHEKDKRIYSVL